MPSPSRSDPGAPPLPRGRRTAYSLGSLVAATIARLLWRTLRVRWGGREHPARVLASGEPCILAFWHEHLLLMRYGWAYRPATALVSLHADGEWTARTLRRLGVDVSRGSTTRGGTRGLKEVVRKVRGGLDAGFAVDGPRGPRRQVQPGVVMTARLCGVPIIPIAFGSHPAYRFRSWDRFLLPAPFARAVFLYGLPIRVGRRAGRDEMEAARVLLEEELRTLTERAERLAGEAMQERGVRPCEKDR